MDRRTLTGGGTGSRGRSGRVLDRSHSGDGGGNERFVAETGYLTVAERPLDAADYPDVDPALLVEGSIVFHPTGGPVQLNDPRQWWSYVPGASWRHPWGLPAIA